MKELIRASSSLSSYLSTSLSSSSSSSLYSSLSSSLYSSCAFHCLMPCRIFVALFIFFLCLLSRVLRHNHHQSPTPSSSFELHVYFKWRRCWIAQPFIARDSQCRRRRRRRQRRS